MTGKITASEKARGAAVFGLFFLLAAVLGFFRPLGNVD